MKYICRLSLLLGMIIASVAFAASGDSVSGPEPIYKIGVLAKRGAARCLEQWSATADYLTDSIADAAFEIVPLDFEEVIPSVKNNDVDFIVANSAFYVELESAHLAARIATLKNLRLGNPYTVFGGVIFCRADRKDIQELSDLRDKRFLAVKESSFGGYLMAWRELKEQGIDPYREFASLDFSGTHDKVVYAIRDGEGDVGTVRTDTLERMASEGKINLDDFRVINDDSVHEQRHISMAEKDDIFIDDFPFRHSTRLYPEWPFAKTMEISNDLAEKVTVALISMPKDSRAAQEAQCAGWTIGHNYSPVHNCLRMLRVGPYKNFGKLTHGKVFRKYWPMMLLGLGILAGVVLFTLHVLKLNRKLFNSIEQQDREIADRKLAEEEQKKSELKFRTLYNSSSDAVMLFDEKGFFDGNTASLKMFGCKDKDELCSMHPSDVSPEKQPCGTDSFVLANERIGFAMETGHNHFEWTHKRVDTEESFDAEVLIDAIELDGKKILQGVVRDISRRKKSEKTLRESEQRFRSLTSLSPTGIYMTDVEGGCVYVNEQWCKMAGLTFEQAKGNGWTRGIHPDDRDRIGTLWAKHARDEKHWECEYRFQEVDGKVTWVLGTASAMRDSKGQITGYIGANTDITDRKNSETELRKLSIAVEQSPATVVITDTKGVIEYVNPKFTETTGYTAEEAIGQNPRVLKSGEMSPQAYQEMWAILNSGKTWRGEFHNKRKDGTLYWESASISPIRNAAGEVINFLAVKEDITVNKQAEEELRDTNLYLEQATTQANEMATAAEMASIAKSDFLANMSHEIRTPMNAIIGFSDILSDESLTAEQMEYVHTIRGSSKSLLTIINDILDFSKIESGKMDLEKIECSLGSLLDNVNAMLQSKAAEKGLDFRVRYQTQLPANLYTDPTRVSQCLVNLINNAIKFTEKGHVHVLVSLEEIAGEPFIRFDVEDTGIGIPASKQKDIFESFSQADTSTTRKFGGTGLGLTITRQLSELLGGSISVQSQSGKGSVFTLMIPTGVDVASQSLLEKNSSKVSATPSSLSMTQDYTGHVLVAEDNSTNQKLIELLLKKMGLQVTIVADGKQAVDAVTTQSFDLIFMDMQMPVMGGHEATEVLRKKGVTLPVVALTGNAMKGDEQECLDAGCDGYMTKPIDRNKLSAMLDKYLIADSHYVV